MLDGKPKDPSIHRDSYSHAQKMRAAVTYAFGRLNGLGSIAWQKSEVSGRMIGNPSVSEAVARYMVSLRKRKVRPPLFICNFFSSSMIFRSAEVKWRPAHELLLRFVSMDLTFRARTH